MPSWRRPTSTFGTGGTSVPSEVDKVDVVSFMTISKIFGFEYLFFKISSSYAGASAEEPFPFFSEEGEPW